MAITEVFDAAGGTTTTTSFTITVPAAAQLGDLMELEFTHRGTGDGTVSDNSGDGVAWTRKGEALFASGTFTVQHYWKRVTAAMVGGGDVITVSGLTNSCAGLLVGYRGAIASGDPHEAWSAEADASGDEAHAEIFTLTDHACVVLVVGNSPDVNVTVPQNNSGNLAIRREILSTGGTDTSTNHSDDVDQPVAGTTGPFSWTQTNGAGGSIAYAITPAATGPSPIDAQPGSYALTGAAATLVSTRLVSASPASYAVTGAAATLAKGFTLNAEPGAYAVTGAAATLVSTRALSADPASYAVTGAAATLAKGYIVTASPGSYAVTGSAATLVSTRLISADPGSYAVTGSAATLARGLFLTADPASYAITAADAELVHTVVGDYTLDCQPGAYVLTGTAATPLAARVLSVDPAAYALTGVAASVVADRIVTASPGSYALTGTAATLVSTRALAADPGVYTLNGVQVEFIYSGSAAVTNRFRTLMGVGE